MAQDREKYRVRMRYDIVLFRDSVGTGKMLITVGRVRTDLTRA
jgi:hypothetical protein